MYVFVDCMYICVMCVSVPFFMCVSKCMSADFFFLRKEARTIYYISIEQSYRWPYQKRGVGLAVEAGILLWGFESWIDLR